MPCKLYRKIKGAPVSPLLIYINRIRSHFSYFWDRLLLLLNGTSYWNAVFCKMIFEILRWTWFGKKIHIAIFSLLMTSSLRQLAIFLQISSFFHLKTRCEMAQHAPFGIKFGQKVDLINFTRNWYRKRHISHYYDVILGDFWPNFGPKGLKVTFKDHATFALQLT